MLDGFFHWEAALLLYCLAFNNLMLSEMKIVAVKSWKPTSNGFKGWIAVLETFPDVEISGVAGKNLGRIFVVGYRT